MNVLCVDVFVWDYRVRLHLNTETHVRFPQLMTQPDCVTCSGWNALHKNLFKLVFVWIVFLNKE